MRALPTLRVASTVLCAAVLVGVVGPAAVAADTGRTHSTAESPAPSAEQLLVQVRVLDGTGTVLQPVIDLVRESLTKGKLDADEAKKLGEAAQQAISAAKADPALLPPVKPTAPATPLAPGAPAKPAAPAAPAAPVAPAAPAHPAAAKLTDAKPSSTRDLRDDELNGLQGGVAKLLKGVTSGLSTVVSLASGVVSGLVNLLTGTLGGVLGTVGGLAQSQPSAH
ncbi:hypothetical protein ACIQB5_05275 [Streptomyces sp. NPDC088560]|uniref:hypothetical protein n=1 Tax=Streptomyces sp. NPDC088560 TaxID=3365868 RepID=UPI00380638F9